MRSRHRFACYALAAALSAGAIPPSAGAAAAITSSVLPNGVTVVTRQRPGSQVMAIDTAVRAGARYEGTATAGATRFLESALLLGTQGWPTRDDLLRAIAGRGGQLSASAGREIVEVSLTVGLPDADLGVAVLADVLLRSRFDPDDLERERDVILQQVQEREDEPEEHATDLLYQTVFEGHPLSRLPSGTSEDVGKLTIDDLRSYWRGRLVGPNVVVAVVSGLPHESVVARLGPALADLPPGPVPALNYADLPERPRVVREPALGTDQSHVFVGARIPGVSSQDRAPLRVVNAILGRSSGRLFTEIRDRRGLAYSAYSTLPQFVDGGAFIVYAGTDPATADEVVALLEAELGRMRAEPVDSVELQNAIEGEIGARTLSLETSANEALYLARDTVFGLPPQEIQAAETRAVTAADVQRVARHYFNPDRLIVVVTRPAADEDAP